MCVGFSLSRVGQEELASRGRALGFVVFAGTGPGRGSALRCEGFLGSLGDRRRPPYCATRTPLNRPPNGRTATVDRCSATVDTAVHSWHGGKVSELNATAAALLGLLHEGPATGGQ